MPSVRSVYHLVLPVLLLVVYLMFFSKTRLYFLAHPGIFIFQICLYAGLLLLCIFEKRAWFRISIASCAVVVSNLLATVLVNITSGGNLFFLREGITSFLELLFYMWLIGGGLFMLICMVLIEMAVSRNLQRKS
jgi:hypothetical protein